MKEGKHLLFFSISFPFLLFSLLFPFYFAFSFCVYPNEKTARSTKCFTRLKTTMIQVVRSPHVVIKKRIVNFFFTI